MTLKERGEANRRYDSDLQAWEREQQRERQVLAHQRDLEAARAEARAARQAAEEALAATGTAASEGEAKPPRRRPGRQYKEDWYVKLAAELIGLVAAGKKIPSAQKMIELCQTESYTPEIRAMQVMMKRMLAKLLPS